MLGSPNACICRVAEYACFKVGLGGSTRLSTCHSWVLIFPCLLSVSSDEVYHNADVLSNVIYSEPEGLEHL